MKELLRKLNSLRHRFVYKIFFAYLLIWLIAFLLIISMIWYYWSEKEIRQSISSYSDILQQNSAYLNFTMHEVKGIVDTITNAESAETALNEGEKYYSENIESWNIVTSKGYRQIRYTLFTSNSITDILLHKKSGILSIENSEFYTKMTPAQQTQLSREIAEMEKYFLWFPMKAADQPGEPVESALYIRKIIDRNRLGNYIGYAVARVPYRVFQDIMGQTEVTSHSDKLLYTDDGDVIVGNPAPLLSGQQVEELVAQGSLERDGVMHRLRLDGKDYLIGSDDMEESGWHLALIIPYEDINENITTSLRFLILLMLLVTVLSLPFIYKMSSSLTGRIGRLKQEMENMESGNPEPGNVEVGNPELGNPGIGNLELGNPETGNLEAGNIEPEDVKSDNKESGLVRKLSGIMGGSDEIDDLTRTFYEMKRQNKQLMQEQYQNGIEIKDLELQELNEQINPHFLYNTLETVYWMGVKNKATYIKSIAQKMGYFYRLSL
ncbi:MAG: histidine kinase, partial [Blautia sp.]|nr:histidine kinase [Blautia sp.]